uniref:Uncharacterized protein n=1 Tax=viral metagenome TaxID=1070528 RepID=A0A6C0IUB1_9ZZZZ
MEGDLHELTLSLTDRVTGFIPKPSTFLGGIINVYGSTGSGKTTTMQEIASLLRKNVYEARLICPSEPDNGNFYGRIARTSVTFDMDSKHLESVFKNIYEQQQARMKQYDAVNALKNLKIIYNKIRTTTTDKIINKLQTERDKMIKECISRGEHAEKKPLKEQFQEMIKAVITTEITKNRERLRAMPLNKNERLLVDNYDMKPDFLLIIDDCTETVNEFQKKKIFKQMIYKARQLRITILLGVHSYPELGTKLRQQARLSIFCNPQASKHFFGNTTVKVEKVYSANADSIMKHIFCTKKLLGYQKYRMVYDQTDGVAPLKFYPCNATPAKKVAKHSKYWKLDKALKLSHKVSDLGEAFGKESKK